MSVRTKTREHALTDAAGMKIREATGNAQGNFRFPSYKIKCSRKGITITLYLPVRFSILDWIEYNYV